MDTITDKPDHRARQQRTPHSVRCRCQQCRTQLLLRAASVRELLTKAYQLTHRMHAATDLNKSADLREMRDLITAEIERRCES